jgi:hypothetical protein
VHLFDDQFNTVVSYPDTRHQGIWDVQFSDLNADGEPEILVGYWGQVGLQGVSLAGELHWRHRNAENISSIAFLGSKAPPENRAFLTDQQTMLIPVDESGMLGAELRVRNRAITTLAAADFDADGHGELCGLALLGLGQAAAIGVNEQGGELWSYPLPEGEHSFPIQRIVPMNFGGANSGWLFPAADGSIHFVGRDGRPIDIFYYGEALQGLAATRINGEPAILVSTPSGIAAWKVAFDGE